MHIRGSALARSKACWHAEPGLPASTTAGKHGPVVETLACSVRCGGLPTLTHRAPALLCCWACVGHLTPASPPVPAPDTCPVQGETLARPIRDAEGSLLGTWSHDFSRFLTVCGAGNTGPSLNTKRPACLRPQGQDTSWSPRAADGSVFPPPRILTLWPSAVTLALAPRPALVNGV